MKMVISLLISVCFACSLGGREPGIFAHRTHRIHGTNTMKDLIHHDETYEILGACFEVYREKGCGFLEGVFQESLEIEFELRAIPAKALVPMRLEYKGRPLRHSYVADFICHDKVIVELKAVSKLVDEHRAQVQNYP